MTTALIVACRSHAPRRAECRKWLLWCIVFVAALAQTSRAQVAADDSTIRAPSTLQTASIHWQDVPLRDAITRMRQLYGENFFVDRRIDPATRITIDMTATGAEPAAAAIAAKHRWSTTRVGDVVYLGPADAASIVKALRDARRGDVAKLPPQQRALFQRKQSIQWPRLTEPRELIQKLVERTGWRVVDDERIPHDLWPAGELKSMTLADQLTLLLIGFNLTFEMDAADQVVRVVELKNPARLAASAPSTRPPRTDPAPAARNPESATKQVYTLRVAEKRVGPVLQELSRRLGWKIEYDDDAIRAADLSLDTRVSFTVENADQDQLLNALLHPAGLTHRHDGDRIIIAPREQ